MPDVQYNEHKFTEMVLYVAERLDGDPSFGATKLNKVLFFADFLYYQQTGRAISGAEYQKLAHGPAPRRLLPVQENLERAGDAKLVTRPYLGYMQKRLVALRDADVQVFEPSELKLLEQVVEAFDGVAAIDVSHISHQASIGWQVTDLHETIPYESVFLRREPLTSSDVERAGELVDAWGS